MRLLTFTTGGGPRRVGAAVGDVVVDLAEADRSLGWTERYGWEHDMTRLLESGDRGLDAAERLAEQALRRGDAVLPRSAVVVGAPVPRPPQLVCAGVNYLGAAESVHFRRGEGPPVFLKATSTICGPDAEIRLPRGVGPVAAEVELAAVIGRRAYRVREADALSYVAGYTILLDVTAQQMLRRDAYGFTPPGATEAEEHIVLFRAKDYDTFTPTGPELVTRDEVEASTLRLQGEVGGAPYVDGSTADMIVGVAELVAYVSSVMTLVPGDVIATGHPGYLRPHPLRPGDRIDARITGLGTLTVGVRADPERRDGPDDQ